MKREDLLEIGYTVAQNAEILHINEDSMDIALLDQISLIMLSKILKEGIIKAEPEYSNHSCEKSDKHRML